jgi:branched-chain amino acid transport system ATP-binding protein
MLRVQNLRSCYGNLEVLRNVSLHVGAGEIVVLIGANGAGKSTALNTIAGLLRPREGKVVFLDEEIQSLPACKVVARGISLVPEGRQLFASLSVLDNLVLGAYSLSRKERRETLKGRLEQVWGLFPILRERRNQPAGTLSGGEQQMLAVGRAFMSRPQLLLLDEPSMGLAPIVAREIFGVIKRLRDNGTTILLVEQNARAALSIANRGYVLEVGMMVAEGSSEELLASKEIVRAYLGKDYKAVWE